MDIHRDLGFLMLSKWLTTILPPSCKISTDTFQQVAEEMKKKGQMNGYELNEN